MPIVDTTAVQAAITQLPLEDLLELNQFVVSRINHERAEKARKMKRQLFIGSCVQFEDGKGNTVKGSVSKVMRKYARVNSDGHTWRVPMNLLTKVTS